MSPAGSWEDTCAAEPGKPVLQDTPPDPAESFAAMEQEISEGERGGSLTSPVLPCKRPWLELTLLDSNNEPAAHANYRIGVPGGGERTGTLDENGYVKLEDVDVPADEVTLQVWIVDDETNPEAPPTYEIQLVSKAEQALETTETEEEPEDPDYFHSSFDGRGENSGGLD